MGDTEYLKRQTAGELQNGLRAEGQDHGEVFASLGDSQEKDGAVCGGVLGTYLHGIFDEPELRSALVNLLSERKNGARGAGTKAAANPAADAPESARRMQERQLDLLADVLRESLDWELIYGAIGI
jgi:cobyric acid synthase